MKNWQLKITPINNKKDDQLSHNIISELLKDKINSLIEINDIPSCICLNGEYGSGKTTIVNLLLKSINGSTTKKVVLFNAWRHKDENIHYALFRNIFYAIKNKNGKDFRDEEFIDKLTKSGEIEDLDNEFNNLVYSSITNNKYDQDSILDKFEDFILNKLDRAMADLLIFTVKKLLFIGVIIGILSAVISFFITFDFIRALKVFATSCIGTIIAGNVIKFFLKEDIKLLPKLIEVHINPDQISTTLPKINNTEQLQGLFRKILNQFKTSKNGKNVELIIIVEDIDRKHNDEIINTLNELRTFIDLGKAIFIIPCDTRNIERAFQEENKSADNVVWKAKDFCAKIFSHSIAIPPQNKQDLRKMLLNKVNTETPNHPIIELLNIKENSLENLVDILIVDSIKTPREAINMFNRFTMQLEYALKLEEDNKRFKKGTISENILEYARVYVLAYYYNLEKYLLEHHELIKWVMKKFRGEINDIPEYGKEYLDELYDNKIIKEQIEEYISRTENYDSDLIKAFIYLDETSYSGIAGNKFYLDIYSYLRNRDKIKLEEIFDKEDIQHISETITKIINNINYKSDYVVLIPSLIDVFDNIYIMQKSTIADFILEHFHSINEKTLYEFNAYKIFSVISEAHNNRQDRAKIRYLGILDKENISQITNEDKVLEICLEAIKKLDQDRTFIGLNYINKINSTLCLELNDQNIENNHVSMILNLINGLRKETVEQVFDGNILKRLSKGLLNKEKVDNDVNYKSLIDIFGILVSKDCIQSFEALEILINKGDIATKEIYLEIVDKYITLIIKKEDIVYICEKINENILKTYFELEDSDKKELEKNKSLFQKGIVLFAKLDNYLYNKLDSNDNDSYSRFIEQLKVALKKASLEDLKYWYEIIDIYEESAEYNFYNRIVDLSLGNIDKILASDNNSIKKEVYNTIINFLTKRSSEDSMDNENENKIINYTITKMKEYVDINVANNENSEYVLDLIKRLIISNKSFIKLVSQELNDKNILINNSGYSFYQYKCLFELLKYMDKNLKYEYVKILIDNIFDRFIRNYPNTMDKAMPAWEFMFYLSESYEIKYGDIANVLDYIFSNYDNRVNFFSNEIKVYVIQIINNYKNYIGDNDLQKYKNLLLEAFREYAKLIDVIKLNWNMYDINNKKEILNLMLNYDTVEEILELSKSNVKDIEELCIDFICTNKIENLNRIYDISSEVLSWKDIINTGIVSAMKQNDSISVYDFNNIKEDLLRMIDISIDPETFDKYFISNIREEYQNKIMTIVCLDKIGCKIEKNSDIFIAIVDNFVNEIVSDTDYSIIEKLYMWLSKNKLVKESNIMIKIKEILKSEHIEDELRKKYVSLLKYGK